MSSPNRIRVNVYMDRELYVKVWQKIKYSKEIPSKGFSEYVRECLKKCLEDKCQ